MPERSNATVNKFRALSETRKWVPFWPVYWRTLLGLPWDWRYDCVPGDGRREVACEHDYPQLFVREDGGKTLGLYFQLLQAVWDGRPLH